MTTATSIGQKLWNYCDVLRNAGLSYGDYLEQLTYLIFLKMMHERSQPPFTMLPDYQPPPIPEGCDWPSLLARDGAELDAHYQHTLETLSQQQGTLGVIFSKAQSRIQEPAMLTRLVKELIPNPPMDGARIAEGGEEVTDATVRARIRVDWRLAGGLSALLGVLIAACDGCGERDGGIGHGKKHSRTGPGASWRGS